MKSPKPNQTLCQVFMAELNTTNIMKPVITHGKYETTIAMPIDADNRQAIYVKRPSGWFGVEAYTLQRNSSIIIDMDDDLAEALDRILAKN